MLRCFSPAQPANRSPGDPLARWVERHGDGASGPRALPWAERTAARLGRPSHAKGNNNGNHACPIDAILFTVSRQSPLNGSKQTAHGVCRIRRRPAYTLLEMILALALATVILGMVAMAIHVNLVVAFKSKARVAEAQLARTLLQRIGEDLRNAVPFQPNAPSSSGSSSSGSSSSGSSSGGSSSGASSGSGGSGSTSASAAATSNTSGLPDWAGTSYSGGLYGSVQELQVDTSHRPRLNLSPTASADAGPPPIPLSAIKTVTYSLGDPGTSDPTQRDGSSGGDLGLYRRELDRATFVWANQQGDTSIVGQAEQMAPEVVDLSFTYYDGITPYDEWDSTTQGKLPSAVRVSLSISRQTGNSSQSGADSGTTTTADNSQTVTYSMLVDLPNAPVQTSSNTTATTSTPTP